MTDPNPRVAGEGHSKLEQAGIRVVSGVMRAAAEALNPGFISRSVRGRPWVTAKVAASLDGRTAMASGESQWITSPAARDDAQKLRARSSAIVTGIGTVLADDPRLNVRLEGASRQPLRVVVDGRLSTPVDASILQAGGQVLIITASGDNGYTDSLRARGVEVVSLPAGQDTVDLPAMLETLAAREVNEVMLEAGATLTGAMLAAGLVDELVMYFAPSLMGSAARGMFNMPNLQQLADRVQLDICDMRAVGRDWRVTAKIAG
jgi:diaminohydroxyphosphoribosylaminopyrimidine deaminase/5-amino-6-(5-phosphoribosylamino)uracil reductase